MARLLLCWMLLFCITTFGNAQVPALEWAKAFTEYNQYNYSVYSNGRSVAVDNAGNVYSTGLFNYTTDFDPGPNVYPLAASNWAKTGIYVSKLSPAGDFLWAFEIATYVEFGNIEINIDKDNNVYVVSELRLPTDFDPGPGTFILTPTGGWDAFVAKYDPNGNLLWAKQFGGPGDTVPRSDVVTFDNSNNVIVCGSFNNTVDFDPGPNTFPMTSTAHIQSFIVKLNTNGEFIWARQPGSSPSVYSGAKIASVICDPQGNIYTVGNYSGTCDFDPGAGNYTLTAQGLQDGYVSKLDANGNFIWARSIGNTTHDYYQYADSRGIALDANNNVYTTGDFAGTFDFDPGTGTHIISSSSPMIDWYILKLTAEGDFGWVAAMGGGDQDLGADIAVGSDGAVYSIGSIGPSVDMDPGPGTYPVQTVNQYGACVLLKLNQNGGFVYAVPFNSIQNIYGTSLTRRMVMDPQNNIFITGYIAGTIDFDPGPAEYALASGSGQAPFVLKLGKCTNPSYSTLSVTTCDSFQLANEVFDSSGTYTRKLINANGCDSIVTLHLVINKTVSKQNVAICEGDVFFAGGAGQTSQGIFKDTLLNHLGCDSVVITSLTVHPRPTPDLGINRSLCAGTQAFINPGVFNSYRWQDGSSDQAFAVRAAGTYYVTVKNEFNCSATDSIEIISMLAPPAGFLQKSDSICSYDKLELKANGAFSQYRWSTGSVNSSAKIDRAGTYSLTVTDGAGCSGTEHIQVTEKNCTVQVYFPSAFSPRGVSNQNRLFRAIVYGTLKSFRLQVYDRYGQLVYETNDPFKGWDGSFKGKPHPNSAFVWHCTYQLEGRPIRHEKGSLIIVP